MMGSEQEPWWVCDQKKRIEECLGTDGFRQVFAEAVSFASPIRWNGYGIADFCNPGKFPEWNRYEKYLNELVGTAIRTCELPRKDILCAAIYFWMWRAHGKGPHFQTGVGALPDGDSEYTYYQFAGAGQWSWFYLLYLDSLTWSFPAVFNGMEEEWNRVKKSPRFRYVYQEVCRHLCGVRTSTARVFSGRTGTEEEYKRICASTQRACWADKYARCTKTPELILALSFYANGFASYKTHPHEVNKSVQDNVDFLYALTEKATRYIVHMPEDEWEARTLFFILAQWLYLRDRKSSTDTLEERIFALLYLRFYRKGVDGYFGRDSMRHEWDAITFEEKEKTAARFRKLLIDTRNKAAKSWPNSIQTDYPETELDDWSSVAFDSIFRDAVRSEDDGKLVALLKESKPSQDTFAQAVLWAASHSRPMYDRLMTLADKYDTVHFKSLNKEQRSMICDGWRWLCVDDLKWSAGLIKGMVSQLSYLILLAHCRRLVYEVVACRDEEIDFDKLQTYVEYMGINPNGPKPDSDSPLAEAVSKEDKDVVEYLLQHGAEPTFGSGCLIPLDTAIRMRYNDIVQMLLQYGADPNQLSSWNNERPLQQAANVDNIGAAELLIDAGADLSLIETHPHENVSTFWHEVEALWKKHANGEKVVSWKSTNMLPRKYVDVHYLPDGTWWLDPVNDEGYDDAEDYAELHPEYVFQVGIGNATYVGIHDPAFAESLGVASFRNIKNGGLVVPFEKTNETIENNNTSGDEE